MSDFDFTDCTDDQLADLHVQQSSIVKEIGFRHDLTTDANALAEREGEVLQGLDMLRQIDAEIKRRSS